MTKRFLAAILILTTISCGSLVKRKEWIQGNARGYGVKAPTEIIRDQYGVPHIRAGNDQDLFYALGYAMAQDRFFQMDLIRRAGRGELCELFGRIRVVLPEFGKKDFLDADKLMRALNFKGRAEEGYREMPAEAKTLLDAFTAGVNRYLKDAGDTIPQYHFFQTKPMPWRPEDSLVCSDIFGLAMTYGQFGTEYYYERMLREIGPEKAKYTLPGYPKNAPTVVNDLPVSKKDDGLGNMLSTLRLIFSFSSGLGSNNWVVDGRHITARSETIA